MEPTEPQFPSARSGNNDRSGMIAIQMNYTSTNGTCEYRKTSTDNTLFLVIYRYVLLSEKKENQKKFVSIYKVNCIIYKFFRSKEKLFHQVINASYHTNGEIARKFTNGNFGKVSTAHPSHTFG